MKKILLFAVLLLSSIGNYAQYVTRLVFASPFQDSLWVVDTLNFQVMRRLGPTPNAGGTITGMNGIAKHPVTGELYIIIKQSAVSGRVLGKLNLRTGVVSIVGNLGDNFASITFNGNNTLLGVTGDGASVSETMYRINTTDASKTLLRTLGNGADGENICFNPDDNYIYHWSGNGTVVFEKIDTAGITVTNIPIIGATNGETFGSVYIGNNKFMIGNVGSAFNIFNTNGNVSPQFGMAPDDPRGMAFVTCSRTITAPALGFCTGDSVLLTSGATDADYQWYFNGALIPGSNGKTHHVKQVGHYNCIVSDQCGVDSTGSGVNIEEFSLPVVTISGNTNICNGSSTTLTASAGSLVSYNWSSGGIDSIETVAPISNQTYTVIVIDNNSCAGSAVVTITVNALPIISINGVMNICNGSSTTLTASGATSYNWSSGGVNATETLSPTSSKTYTITGIDDNSCESRVVITVTVNPMPAVNLSGNTNLCPGGNLILTGTSGGTSQWYMNGVFIPGANSNTYTVTAAGVYNMTKTNISGCKDSSAVGKIIIQVANPIVSVNGVTTICNGSSTTLTASGAISYNWSSGSTTAAEILSPTITETYTVTGTDVNSCINTAVVTVTVNSLPIVNINGNTHICKGASTTLTASGATNYVWSNGSSTAAITVSPTASVTYTVTGTDGGGCKSMAVVTVTVNTCLGVSEIVQTGDIKFWPNPACENVQFDLSDIVITNQYAMLNFYNAVGEIVYSEHINGNGKQMVDISKFPSGLYFIQVIANENKITSRLIIEH